jgi:diguanylate cyclase (GGDEF)-like protein
MQATATTKLLAMLSRPTILLVENDEQTRDLITHHAVQEGLITHACSNAEIALHQMQETFHPIVITDIQMSGMGGLALCRKLRAGKFPGYVYIIVLTGHDHEPGVVEAFDAGADDYLCKGRPPAELLARLRAAERIVTLEHRLRRTLENKTRQAALDVLTGLPNRRAFNRQFNAEFKRALRFGEPLSLLLIDIDHFKNINDRFGHLMGDKVLRQVATILRSQLPREFDLLARIGGEEFAAALPHTDGAAAVVVAERLRSALSEHAVASAVGPLHITLSIGIACLSSRAGIKDPTTIDLLEEADHCLYQCKRQGRNRVMAGPSAQCSGLVRLP